MGLLKIAFLYNVKNQCKKIFALHLRLYIPIPQYWTGVSCIYEIMITFKSPTLRILFRTSPAFTCTLIISSYNIIFI